MKVAIAKVIGANNKKDGYIKGSGYIVTWWIVHLVGLAVPSVTTKNKKSGCNKNIYEGEKNYYCEGYKENPKCTYVLWEDYKFYGKITKTQAKKLIKGERILFKKLKIKKGTDYEAYLKLEDTGTYINLKFDSYNK